jgi:hypothetical protein
MDLSKLLAILNDRALFFPSGRQLSRADRLEGQPTYVEVDRLNYDPTAISPENKAAELGVHDPEKLTAFLELERKHQVNMAGFIENSCFFSCWHMNDDESDAMWKIYARTTAGVAIRSTLGRLQSAFTPEPRPIFLGRIKYIDFNADYDSLDIFVRRFMRKSKAFRHEQELRAVLHDPEKLNSVGERVSIDPAMLIEKIVISPTEEEWFRALVESIIKKMGYTFEVVASGAARVPPLMLITTPPS